MRLSSEHVLEKLGGGAGLLQAGANSYVLPPWGVRFSLNRGHKAAFAEVTSTGEDAYQIALYTDGQLAYFSKSVALLDVTDRDLLDVLRDRVGMSFPADGPAFAC